MAADAAKKALVQVPAPRDSFRPQPVHPWFAGEKEIFEWLGGCLQIVGRGLATATVGNDLV